MSNKYKFSIFFLIVLLSISTLAAQTNATSSSVLKKELKEKYQEKISSEIQ